MTRRPLTVTIISWIFICSGAVGLVYHASELDLRHPLADETLWVCFVRLLAIVGGVGMLRGANWARWLSIAWIAYHVALSAAHSLLEVVVHGVLCAVFAFFLFRPQASAYFRNDRELDG
jgi:hypothetical protein